MDRPPTHHEGKWLSHFTSLKKFLPKLKITQKLKTNNQPNKNNPENLNDTPLKLDYNTAALDVPDLVMGTF